MNQATSVAPKPPDYKEPGAQDVTEEVLDEIAGKGQR